MVGACFLSYTSHWRFSIVSDVIKLILKFNSKIIKTDLTIIHQLKPQPYLASAVTIDSNNDGK